MANISLPTKQFKDMTDAEWEEFKKTILGMSEEEWQEYRKLLWKQKQETFRDKDNVPDWFWPTDKPKYQEIRRKAWAKKCRFFSQSTLPPEKYVTDKKSYIKYCEMGRKSHTKSAAK